jgi:hypothetical protein
MRQSFLIGIIACAAFATGAFAASPELRAYAAATITSTDIVDNTIQSIDIKDAQVKTADLAANAVTAGKIKDAEVKAAEIAPDSVGGSELMGVDKLLFGSCPITLQDQVFIYTKTCDLPGAAIGDHVMVAFEGDWTCGTNPVMLNAYVPEASKVNVNFSGSTTCGDDSLIANLIIFR